MESLFRHGDLLLRATRSIPKNTPRMSGTILEHGETTGHKHVFSSGQIQLFGTENVSHVLVEKDATLTHEEHKPITIPHGQYEVIREKEYNPFAEDSDEWRRVLD